MRCNYVITDEELLYIDCTCKNGLIASYRFNTYLHLKHIHVYSNKVLVLLMNKIHAMNLDIDGLCQILLCVQIFITSIKSLNHFIALHCVILTENLILNSFFNVSIFQFRLSSTSIRYIFLFYIFYLP